MDRTLHDEAERLLHAIAPEYAGVPCYFVPAGAVGSACPVAYTSPRHCEIVRPQVQGWRGPGFAMTYRRDALAEIAPPGQLPRLFHSIAVHEFAHGIVEGWLARAIDPTTAPVAEDVAAAVALRWASDHAQNETEDTAHRADLGDFLDHPASFIRTALHLLWRAHFMFGMRLRADIVIGNHAFSPWAYEEALADEPSRMRDKPFAEILARPLPKAFRRMRVSETEWFVDDVARFAGFDPAALTPMARATLSRAARAGLAFSLPERKETSMTILQAIASAFTKRRRDELLTFADLVRTVADGAAADPTKATEILRTAGKTPEDLAAAVTRLQERREHRKKIDAAKDADAKRTELTAKIAAADGQLEAAKERHRQTVRPLYFELDKLKHLESQADNAVDALRGMADDEQRARRVELHQENNRLGQQRIRLARELEDTIFREKANATRRAQEAAQIRDSRSGEWHDTDAGAKVDYQKSDHVLALEQQLAELDAEIAANVSATDALLDEMLTV